MEVQVDVQQRSGILGTGEPFATRWPLGLILGVLAYGIYWLGNPVIVQQFDAFARTQYTIPVYYGPAALLMLGMFALHRRVFPDIRFFGDIPRAYAVRCLLTVSLLYLATYGAALALGQQREPVMMALYMLKTPTQNVVMVLSLLVLPPIVEELAFRHFLLSALPFRASRTIAVIAMVATSLLFSFQHRNYIYPSTLLLLFALGIVFSRARIRTGGLALSIALHSYSVGFALICDRVVAHISG